VCDHLYVRFGWWVQPVDATPYNCVGLEADRLRVMHGYGSRHSSGQSSGSDGRTVNVWRTLPARLNGRQERRLPGVGAQWRDSSTAAAESSAGAESPYSMITFYRDLYLFCRARCSVTALARSDSAIKHAAMTRLASPLTTDANVFACAWAAALSPLRHRHQG
jgi:hypothetical protein